MMESRALDAAEKGLGDWVRSILGKEKVEVVWGLPPTGPKSATVGLTLLEVLPTPSPRGTEKPPLKLKLRYLMTVGAPDPQDAHRILVALSFAAMDRTDWETEFAPLPASMWQALGVPLQPSLVLLVPLLQERPVRRIQRVREPMVLQAGSLRAITGTVLGPGDLPIMGAEVDLPSLGRAARTDHRGYFRLAAVPTKPEPESLRVRARGVEESVDLAKLGTSGDEPLVIHLKQLED